MNNNMPVVEPHLLAAFNPCVHELWEHEQERLLEALRRDLRSEQDKMTIDPDRSIEHSDNVRHVKGLLQLLNPKTTRRK